MSDRFLSATGFRDLTTGRACCSGPTLCPACRDTAERLLAPQLASTDNARGVSFGPSDYADEPPSVADFLKNPRDPAPPTVMPGRNTADDPPSVADVIREQFEKGTRV